MHVLSTILLGAATLFSVAHACDNCTLHQPNSTSRVITEAQDQADSLTKRAPVGGTFADWVWWDAHNVYKAMHLGGRAWNNNHRREMDLMYYDLMELRKESNRQSEDFEKESRYINELHNMGRVEILAVWEDAIKNSPNYRKYGNGEALTAEERERSMPHYYTEGYVVADLPEVSTSTAEYLPADNVEGPFDESEDGVEALEFDTTV